MSRQIEFRVWDKETKFFNNVVCGNILQQLHDKDESYDNIFENRYIIEQYSGMNDKNNIKIFEGDILKGQKSIYDYGHYSIVHFYEGSFCISIAYDLIPICLSDLDTIYEIKSKVLPHEEFMLLFNKYKGSASEIAEFEVVGNIHENPELLTPPHQSGGKTK